MMAYSLVEWMRIFLTRTLLDNLAALIGNNFRVNSRPPMVLGLGVYRTVRWQAKLDGTSAPAVRLVDSFTGLIATQFEYTYLVMGSEIKISTISPTKSIGY